MSWENITAGNYGFEGKLTLVQDAVAQDISAYTTTEFLLTDPLGAVATKTASFVTDGTDGALKYDFAISDIAMAGQWYVRAQISKTGSLLTSDYHPFYVEA